MSNHPETGLMPPSRESDLARVCDRTLPHRPPQHLLGLACVSRGSRRHATGLGLLGIAQGFGVSLADAVSLIGLACLVAGALMFLFPETRQQELEALNEARDGAGC